MSKNLKTITLGALLVILAITGFLFEIKNLSLISLTMYSALAFFHNIERITIGVVKLFCLNIGITMFLIYGDALVSTRKSLFIGAILWAIINFFAIQRNINKKKIISED